MRHYRRILEEAQATGTYTSYVGDGFSVPWQVALWYMLPLGVTMWGYKGYLDSRYPECAKIHDWCYTPYGKLIDVTREEADLAIYECILEHPFSSLDGWIVYRAVRYGGEPYFGVSQTGYSGPQAQIITGNIGLALPSQGDP